MKDWNRVDPRNRAENVPEPTGGKTAERGGEAALRGDHWRCDVPCTGHPLRHPLRCQPAGEDHIEARESSHGGDRVPPLLLGRVDRLPHPLIARRLQACCLLGCQLGNSSDKIYVGLQGLAVQSPMGAVLVAAASTMKEAVFCSNMMLKLGFDEGFGNLLLYIDNTSALRAAGNRTCTYSLCAKNIALRYFSCKSWWRRARSASSASRSRFSWRTWVTSTVTTISLIS